MYPRGKDVLYYSYMPSSIPQAPPRRGWRQLQAHMHEQAFDIAAHHARAQQNQLLAAGVFAERTTSYLKKKTPWSGFNRPRLVRHSKRFWGSETTSPLVPPCCTEPTALVNLFVNDVPLECIFDRDGQIYEDRCGITLRGYCFRETHLQRPARSHQNHLDT